MPRPTMGRFELPGRLALQTAVGKFDAVFGAAKPISPDQINLKVKARFACSSESHTASICGANNIIVMDPLPEFPLFPNPVREGVIEKSKVNCDFCNQSRGYLYTTNVYRDSVESVICPWCIADGTAETFRIQFNDTQLSAGEQLTTQDLGIAIWRTPGISAWQANYWLACCGRACIYLGTAGEAELNGKWKEAASFLVEDLAVSAEESDSFISDMSRDGSPRAYVFQCQTCKKLLAFSDCD